MRRRLTLVPLAVAASAAALTAPLVLAQLGLDHDTRFVPAHERVLYGLWMATWSAPILYGILLATVCRAALRSLRRPWLYIVGTVIGLLGLLLGALAAVVNTDPHLFRGRQIAQATSIDHRHTAYLFEGGLMCGYDVFVAETGANTMRRARSFGVSCADQKAGASLVWNDPVTLEIRSARGLLYSVSIAR